MFVVTKSLFKCPDCNTELEINPVVKKKPYNEHILIETACTACMSKWIIQIHPQRSGYDAMRETETRVTWR